MNLPPIPPSLPTRPASIDDEHLNLLSLFHYIAAGLGALTACLPAFHVFFGIMMLNGGMPMESPSPAPNGPPPALFAYMFIGLGCFFILAGWASAILVFLSGRYLKRREKRVFSMVVAGVLCMFAPLGTILGVFTFIVLGRESVKRLYEENNARRAPSA